MKFSCTKSDLLEAISYTQRAVSTRSTMAVLEGILVEVSDVVKLTGYDTEIGIEATVMADIRESGTIVINSKIFGDIVRKLPDELVVLHTEDRNTVVIECGRSKFQIKGLDAESFPSLPEVKEEIKLVLPQAMLKEMIRQTIFAASTDEARPNLNCAYLVSQADELEMVAIDGFRLALRRFKRDSEDEKQKEAWPDASFIIQAKALREINSMIRDTGIVSIFSSDNSILFDLGNVRLVSRLIQGQYMNYQSIIPTSEQTHMNVETRKLQNAFERSLLMISAENNRFPVTITTPDEETLFLDVATVRGTLHEEIEVGVSGRLIDCDFNPRFFLDALRVIDDERIVLSFKGDVGPCVIRAEENEDKFAFIVLPLRK